MINYIMGDATDPWIDGNKIIAHVCNDIGGWGRGFVLSLRERWPFAEQQYRRWHQEDHNMPGMEDSRFVLGNVQFVPVSSKDNGKIIVANMIAQRDVVIDKDGRPPIRYDALSSCLRKVNEMAECIGNATVHMPRIGCGLAGGSWSEVEKIIAKELSGCEVYVYDMNNNWTK